MAARLDEFVIGVKPQREWGWLVISYLFVGGAGAGLYLVALYLGHLGGRALGLLLLLLGTMLLFLDLGRPLRFWRAFRRPHSSWISRGCFFIALLIASGGAELYLAWSGAASAALSRLVEAAAGVAAVLVMLYTGFVLAPSPSIPFWNSAFFPAIFFAYSLLAGIDFLLLASPLLPGAAPDLLLLEQAQQFLAVACLVLVLSHVSVMSSSTEAARESIRLLTRGRWGALFLAGVIGLGLLVPLVATPMLWRAGLQGVFAATAAMALLRLVGDYLFRYLVLRVGLYDPLL